MLAALFACCWPSKEGDAVFPPSYLLEVGVLETFGFTKLNAFETFS